jgi:hypothetical protein
MSEPDVIEQQQGCPASEKRKLARIEKIEKLEEIPGADKIEKATILGWECVVKKGEFKVGDQCVYIEVDSILPVIPYFFFMEPRRYRVKTIKLRKQISQGLVLPLSAVEQIVKELNKKVDVFKFSTPCGTDITDLLGITKHDPQGKEEATLVQESKNPIHKYLLRYKWYSKLFIKKKARWPYWIQKTDEERIQNIPSILVKHKDTMVYWTEKLDGQSASYSYSYEPIFKFLNIFRRKLFTVCSRKMWLKHRSNKSYWQIVDKYNLEKELLDYNRRIVIQGEIVGPGIQKNKYDLKEYDFYVFNVYDIDQNVWLGPEKSIKICDDLSLKFVPLLGRMQLSAIGTIVPDFVALSKGRSALLDRQREGIVVRQCNDSPGKKGLSFKVISPDFLLSEDE